MNAPELTQLWTSKKLQLGQIIEYLRVNIAPLGVVYPEDLSHLAFCCFSLYRWATDQQASLGDFLTAVKDDKLSLAAQYSDGINRRNLWVYPFFLYNVAPMGWNKKGEGDEQNVG